MTDKPAELFLIAHKVRGEPAFDIATRIPCPECAIDPEVEWGCAECDMFGYWWIVPTSGHRAFPYWSEQLHRAVDWAMCSVNNNAVPPMPDGLPDHYLTRAAPSAPKPAFLQSLLKPAAPPRISINRRGF
jgi:hypothetical protein